MHPKLGPITLCTVICTDLERSRSAYETHLGLHAGDRFTLDAATAAALGLPELAEAPARLLSNARQEPWLLQVEYPAAVPRDALNSYGWLAQELLVEDVDALAASLEGSAFSVLRPPRNLDVSNLIRACQVRGPDGEILYLTQVNGEVPDSELPQNAEGVDHLFIAVLSTPDRDASLQQYAALSGNAGSCFDMRISVVNQHRGWDLERKHPIATLQLAGRTLIEIDGLEDTADAPQGPCAGTASIAFLAEGPAPASAALLSDGPLAGHMAEAHRGVAGECFTLLYRAPG
jgi:hypothetical protein